MTKIKYAIGQQSFEQLRRDKAIYVDKTRFVYEVATGATKYYFLARPRRFGKSLFLSTLRSFFEGKKELFDGLYVEEADWKWEEYPVLYIDLNIKKFENLNGLLPIMNSLFTEWEKRYDLKVTTTDISVRLKEIIEGAHRVTGKQVVILVDEYDKPLVGNLNKNEFFEHYREALQNLYANFKTCADHIKLVFMTGVSRFSKLSIFSGINNIKDITLLDDYSEICGISERELHENLRAGITLLGEANGVSYEEAAKELKDNYDGYRFSKNSADIYNPWSVLNALDDKEISNYWNRTGGIPTIIAESLRRTNIEFKAFFHTKCSQKDLEGMDLRSSSPLALLYQTGYITIKSYDAQRKRFTLGIPNREVKEGLMDILLPYYADLKSRSISDFIWNFTDLLEDGNADGFMRALESFFSGITYELHMDNENNFQNAIFVLLSLLGLEVKAEEKTSDGRIDLLIETKEYIYLIELKYNGSAQEALSQIEEKRYDLPYQATGKVIIKIGANFDSTTRRINDWMVRK